MPTAYLVGVPAGRHCAARDLRGRHAWATTDTVCHVQAVVLVGGEGTRLRPLTLETPKPMVPIMNMPFLERTLRRLKEAGIEDVLLPAGYLPDAITSYFGDGSRLGLRLQYVIEESPLGTAGALKNIERLIDGPFFVLNGDVFTSLDLRAMLAFHRAKGGIGTLHLIRVEDPSAFGCVVHDEVGRIRSFVEKPQRNMAPTDEINAGTYLLEREVLDSIPAGRDAVEDLALEEVRPGVDLVGRSHVALRLLHEASDPADLVMDDAPEGAGILDPDQVQGADPALSAVKRQHRPQVERGEHVPVEDEEWAVDEPLDVLQRPGGAERGLLDDVLQAEPEPGAVPEVRGDRVGEVAGGQQHVLDPGFLEAAQRPLEEGHVHDRDHGFRRLEGQRAEPRALTADEDDCLHVTDCISCSPRMPAAKVARRTVPACWHTNQVSCRHAGEIRLVRGAKILRRRARARRMPRGVWVHPGGVVPSDQVRETGRAGATARSRLGGGTTLLR